MISHRYNSYQPKQSLPLPNSETLKTQNIHPNLDFSNIGKKNNEQNPQTCQSHQKKHQTKSCLFNINEENWNEDESQKVEKKKPYLQFQYSNWSEIKKEVEVEEPSKGSDSLRVLNNILETCLQSSENDERDSTYIKQCRTQESQLISIQSSEQINKEAFPHMNIERGKKLSVLVSRLNSGLSYFLPQLDMNFADDVKHILSCKKQVGAHSTYYFSISKEVQNEYEGGYCGKIRGNFLGNNFNIYGYSFKSQQKRKTLLGTTKFLEEKENLPKPYEVYLLKENQHYEDLQGNQDKDKGLDELFRIGQNRQKMYYFTSRRPQFCKKTSQFNLDFHGRVKRASVKNFILEDPKSGREVLMFGKNEDNIFNMDISHPLNAFIAFAIILPFF